MQIVGSSSDVETVVHPGGEAALAALGEAWRGRGLAGFLVWRDVKVRYKQSILGVAWAIVQPVSLALVFGLFLGRFAGVPSEAVPYWLMALSGVVPFTFFSQATTSASGSLVDSAALVTKVYVPRLLIPASAAASPLLDCVIATVVLIVAAAVAGSVAATAPIAILVPFGVWFVALSFGLLLSAANVKYRDIKAGIPLLLQLWLFVSPVAYPLALVPDRYRFVYSLNPMVGIVELERYLILGSGNLGTLLPGAATTVVFLAIGMRYFLRSAAWFADVI